MSGKQSGRSKLRQNTPACRFHCHEFPDLEYLAGFDYIKNRLYNPQSADGYIVTGVVQTFMGLVVIEADAIDPDDEGRALVFKNKDMGVWQERYRFGPRVSRVQTSGRTRSPSVHREGQGRAKHQVPEARLHHQRALNNLILFLEAHYGKRPENRAESNSEDD
jgi:hypothetical protein